MRYKGRTPLREIETRFPNHVEFEIPPRGLGARIMILGNWLRLRGCEYANWSRSDRAAVKAYAVYGFASDADALAFEQYWSSIRDLSYEEMQAVLGQQEAQLGSRMSHVTPAQGHASEPVPPEA